MIFQYRIRCTIHLRKIPPKNFPILFQLKHQMESLFQEHIAKGNSDGHDDYTRMMVGFSSETRKNHLLSMEYNQLKADNHLSTTEQAPLMRAH